MARLVALWSTLAGFAHAETAKDAPVRAAAGGAPTIAGQAGFSASVRKAAGAAPVLLAVVKNAIEARSADGQFKATIVPGPFDQAVYDPTLELLWVRHEASLDVWDLRQEKPTAIPVLVDAPEEGDFEIVRGEHRVHPPGMCVVPGTTTINWQKHPSVSVKGFDEMDTPPHPRLEGAAWLARQLDRSGRQVSQSRLPLPAASGQGTKVTLSRSVGKCPDRKECGSGVPFGSTGWTLVIGTEDPGSDCEHYRCLLHDPQAKTFGKPPMPTQWKADAQRSMLGDCGLYRFEPGGKWFAINNQVCAVGGGCQDLGKSAQVLGWLDGEQDVGTDN